MFLMKLSLIKTNCLLPVEHIVSSDLDVEDSNDLVEGLCSYINIEVIKTRGGGEGHGYPFLDQKQVKDTQL